MTFDADAKEAAMEFWYKFDNHFLFTASNRIKEATNLVLKAYGLTNQYKFHFKNNSLNKAFKEELKSKQVNNPQEGFFDLKNVAGLIELLGEDHISMMDGHFNNNAKNEQLAFVYFGEGILFDSRRRPGTRIHMMDGSIAGYFTWHAFVRSAVLLGVISNEERWLQIDRYIALAAAVDKEKEPVQTEDPNFNNPIDPERLQNLQTTLLNMSFDELDKAFNSNLRLIM